MAERRPDRSVPPMAGTDAIGAVEHLPEAVIEESWEISSTSGILADISYCVLLACPPGSTSGAG
ncbi:hypothetical protein GCM10022254_11810 [Actinomadura meridiana]|uniref:Uncharacterized protein n=1 Tax=Actinomadura meridiana TaxID=559626 RepID=A0ABP8BUB8_9ACTN